MESDTLKNTSAKDKQSRNGKKSVRKQQIMQKSFRTPQMNLNSMTRRKIASSDLLLLDGKIEKWRFVEIYWCFFCLCFNYIMFMAHCF